MWYAKKTTESRTKCDLSITSTSSQHTFFTIDQPNQLQKMKTGIREVNRVVLGHGHDQSNDFKRDIEAVAPFETRIRDKDNKREKFHVFFLFPDLNPKYEIRSLAEIYDYVQAYTKTGAETLRDEDSEIKSMTINRLQS